MKQLQFFVGQSDCGSFFALNPQEPYFCVKRDTEEAAVDAGLRAWEFYLSLENNPEIKTREIKRSPFTSIERSFIPQQVIFAEAC